MFILSFKSILSLPLAQRQRNRLSTRCTGFESWRVHFSCFFINFFFSLKWTFLNWKLLLLGCDGVWWCVMVCGGVWWCVVMCRDVRWCVVMCHDVWWCVVVCGGVWWCVVVCHGVWWCVVLSPLSSPLSSLFSLLLLLSSSLAAMSLQRSSSQGEARPQGAPGLLSNQRGSAARRPLGLGSFERRRLKKRTSNIINEIKKIINIFLLRRTMYGFNSVGVGPPIFILLTV